jgi:hypothetical protein
LKIDYTSAGADESLCTEIRTYKNDPVTLYSNRFGARLAIVNGVYISIFEDDIGGLALDRWRCQVKQ